MDPEQVIRRPQWQQRIEQDWQTRSVIWLSGVRRVGKTCLCQSLGNIEYFDCESPRVARLLEDPDDFWSGLKGKRVVLDEIHRLDNPSQVLKIAADHYPTVRVIATGSSTLGASKKFRDTLTGRKWNLWLTPMVLADISAFGQEDIRHRLFYGGLPPFFLARALPEREIRDWMDSYWAKDVQELFRLDKRDSFLKLTELLMIHSGGMFSAASLAGPCGVSRPTLSTYVKVLEETFVVHVLRPFHGKAAKEVVSTPKIFAFDTGFVCYYRGWSALREQDMGTLWEHFVLNEMQAALQGRQIHYWRDRQKHEVDFIWKGRGRPPLAIECKWSASGFDDRNLQAFRRLHPDGENVVVAHDVDRPFTRTCGELQVSFESLPGLTTRLTG